MSPRARKPLPPAASRRKRILHAFYLAQPLFQFIALMAVLLILGRCSPLAPSTDRSINKSSNNALSTQPSSERGNNSASEEDITNILRDISRHDELALISQSDFSQRILPRSLQAERPADLEDVRNLFRQRARGGFARNTRLLVLSLTTEQKENFFRSGSLRIALSDTMRLTPEVRKYYFGELHKIPRSELSAKALLVMSDDEMASPESISAIPVPTKFQLGIDPTDEKAWFQVSRTDSQIDEQQQKLIESAKSRSISMVLVLE